MMDDLFADKLSNHSIGIVQKMRTKLAMHVQYFLPLGDEQIHLNPLIGQSIVLEFTGLKQCLYCKKTIKKSYGQGYCYDHFMSLAQNDACMMSPEKCHFEQGTCRDNLFAESVCNQGHYVYLSNTSDVKVGITRISQIPTRWIDQGASQAMLIARVSSRYLAGCVETVFKQCLADKTNWRNMLKGPAIPIDLEAILEKSLQVVGPAIDELQQQFGPQAIQLLKHSDTIDIEFPVNQYLSKIASLNLDKQAKIEGRLLGIKGQYLIFEQGVINLRKYGGYQLKLSY